MQRNPVRKVQGGYQWGTSGKVYTREVDAQRQAAAIYASGWREDMKTSKRSSRRVRNPAIGIDPDFYLAAVKDYRGWELKWWREVYQNGVDASATKIQAHSRGRYPGTSTLTQAYQENYFLDNGKGMDQNILLNKFLMLGGTTKTASGGSAGGFGKAKELVLLPWLWWHVVTKTAGGPLLEAIGQGTSYDLYINGRRTEASVLTGVDQPDILGKLPGNLVTLTGSTKTGTYVAVGQGADLNTNSLYAEAFLDRCSLPGIALSVGGKRITAKLNPRKVVRTLTDPSNREIGYVYFVKNKSAHSDSQLVVRTTSGSNRKKKLFMFAQWLSSDVKGQVILDITGPSIAILTANRDGLRYPASEVVARFTQEIAADNRSWKKTKQFKRVYPGDTFKAEIRAQQIEDVVGPESSPTGGFLSQSVVEEVVELAKQQYHNSIDELSDEDSEAFFPTATPEAAETILVNIDFTGPEQFAAAAMQLAWTPSFMISNEFENWKPPPTWMPEKMSKRAYALSVAWVEICRYVMVQLGSPEPYGVGFIFSEDVGAQFEVTQNVRWLLINPFRETKSRKQPYSPKKKADLKWLYACAVHECTHLVTGISEHNEAFSTAITYSFAQCADGWTAVAELVGLDEDLKAASGKALQNQTATVTTKLPAATLFQQAMDALLEEEESIEF